MEKKFMEQYEQFAHGSGANCKVSSTGEKCNNCLGKGQVCKVTGKCFVLDYRPHCGRGEHYVNNATKCIDGPCSGQIEHIGCSKLRPPGTYPGCEATECTSCSGVGINKPTCTHGFTLEQIHCIHGYANQHEWHTRDWDFILAEIWLNYLTIVCLNWK